MNAIRTARRPLRVILCVPPSPERRDLAVVGASSKAAHLFGRIRDRAAWFATQRWFGSAEAYETGSINDPWQHAAVLGLRRQLLQAFRASSLIIEEVTWGQLATAAGRTGADAPHLIVICGSGYLTLGGQGRVPEHLEQDIAALAGITCPVAAISLSLNAGLQRPQATRFDAFFKSRTATFLSRLAFRSVEDTPTQNLLNDVTGIKIDVIANPALFLFELPSPPEVIPSRLSARARSHLKVGISLAFSGPGGTELQRATLPTLVNGLRQFSADAACEFVYHALSSSDDAMIRALQAAGLTCRSVATGLYAPDLYSGLDLHLGQPPQSSALAASLGVPVLCLAHDTAGLSVAHLLGMQRFGLDMWRATSQEIATAASELQMARAEHSSHLLARRQCLESASQIFFEQIATAARDHAQSFLSFR